MLMLLLLILSPSMIHANQQIYTPDSSFEYHIEDDEVTILGFMGTETEVVIPPVIEGYPVTTIGEYAFIACNDIWSITIPVGVTTIDYGAFYL